MGIFKIRQALNVKGSAVLQDTLQLKDGATHLLTGFAAPSAVGAANAIGSNNTAARSDHIHAPYPANALGVGNNYLIARGSVAVTGSQAIATGLTNLIALTCTPNMSTAGTAWVAVSNIFANGGVGGSATIYAWQPTSTSVPTLIAATTAVNVTWIAIGT